MTAQANIINIAAAGESPLTSSVHDVEAQITRVIENTIGDLEALRYGIESAGSKYGLVDVRDHRGTGQYGAVHLRGFEGVVRYDDLVKLINVLTLGLARRRVELASS